MLAPILTRVCLPSMAGRSHEAPGTPSHSDSKLHRHSKLDLSQRLGDLTARGTMIGHVCRCQDMGLSWKSASSRAGRGLDRHLSNRTLWADCDYSGREPGNVRCSFAGRILERKPNDYVPLGFILSRLGFVRRHRVCDDAHAPPSTRLTSLSESH